MKTLSLDVPAMYADHHVVEVRRLLTQLPGVENVYASSAFRVVEVDFDEKHLQESAIHKALDEAGYLADLEAPLETGEPADGRPDSGTWYRHSAAREAIEETVAFEQHVPHRGPILWPCPGMERTGKIED